MELKHRYNIVVSMNNVTYWSKCNIFLVQHEEYSELFNGDFHPVPDSRGELIELPKQGDNFIRITKNGKQHVYAYKKGNLIPVY